MSITIKNFKVDNTTSGKMPQTGRRTLTYLETILSSGTFLNDLVERQAIPGTPATISAGNLVGKAHMSTKYIQVIRENGYLGIDKVFCSTKLRITKISGTSSAANMICYAWSSDPNILPTALTWNVLFANFNQQTQGDYIDIDLPDSTFYPNLYLSLILINDAWKSRTIVDATQKICSVPGNLDYFCINPNYSKADVGQSHCVNIQAYNVFDGLQDRVCVAFEDWYMAQTDRDYNDVVLAIQDAFLDTNNVNDTSIS